MGRIFKRLQQPVIRVAPHKGGYDIDSRFAEATQCGTRTDLVMPIDDFTCMILHKLDVPKLWREKIVAQTPDGIAEPGFQSNFNWPSDSREHPVICGGSGSESQRGQNAWCGIGPPIAGSSLPLSHLPVVVSNAGR